jgi:hypothetical protein
VHLLGLTATPERTDALDILRWFDGRMAVELRLWDALEQDLLAPFHYYGIHDGTDLSGVTWKRGRGYDATELTNVYTGDDLWVGKVLAAVREKVGDPQRMRALGFGVSIAHCEFLANRFNRAGLTARAVSANSTSGERDDALRALASGDVRILFSVDLFNEGIDVPAVDVVLMVRPTESATVFLQQLGRGLRRSHGKDVLTVLDFVGHQTKAFRFDLRYRRMLGRTRREIERDVAEDFPYLPAGCQMRLDPVAKSIVLDNIRTALPSRWPERIRELRELGDVPLAAYLQETGLEPDDVYQGGHSFTEMRRAAGFLKSAATDDESRLGRGLGRLLHLDDLDRIDAYTNLLSSRPAEQDLDARETRQLQGLLLTLLSPRKGTFASLDEAARLLWSHDHLRGELLELLPLVGEHVTHLHVALRLLQPVPLQVHATYTREEVLAGFGASTVTAPLPLQTGVYWHEGTRTDLFFITLQKTEKHYSPTTLYRDYAISDRLFHWESQSTTAAASATASATSTTKRWAPTWCSSSARAARTSAVAPAPTSAPAERATSSTDPNDPCRSPGSCTTLFPGTSSAPSEPQWPDARQARAASLHRPPDVLRVDSKAFGQPGRRNDDAPAEADAREVAARDDLVGRRSADAEKATGLLDGEGEGMVVLHIELGPFRLPDLSPRAGRSTPTSTARELERVVAER